MALNFSIFSRGHMQSTIVHIYSEKIFFEIIYSFKLFIYYLLIYYSFNSSSSIFSI
jgi:hypothetical protein